MNTRPMTTAEVAAAKALATFKYPVASFSKRFARSMDGLAAKDKPEITEKQAACLWRQLLKFRRQLALPEVHLLHIAREKTGERA